MQTRLLLGLALVVGSAGCIVATSNLSLSSSGARTRRETVGMRLGLGERRLTTVNAPSPTLAIADSVMRDMGWQLASFSESRNELATEWLYLAGPTFNPAFSRRCDDGASVGVRFFLTRRVDSPQYTLRGEMQMLPHADDHSLTRSQAENVAHQALDAMSQSLSSAFSQLANDDSTRVRLDRVSGEISGSTTRGVKGCGTLR